MAAGRSVRIDGTFCYCRCHALDFDETDLARWRQAKNGESAGVRRRAEIPAFLACSDCQRFHAVALLPPDNAPPTKPAKPTVTPWVDSNDPGDEQAQ